MALSSQGARLEHVQDERVPGAAQHLDRQLESPTLRVDPFHELKYSHGTIKRKVT